ncbi:MAG: dUTP diphosphatase [Amoebophilaceae bacterium]|nr:dUTP diphosphatase [Amoebophilaceae bacterium]
MKIEIVSSSHHPLPAYATVGASGMDLRAYIETPITIMPLQRVLVGTGLAISLPVGYEAQVRSRSGLTFKQGIMVLNSPGTIDSDYRGEIKVLLMNLSDQPFVVQNGDRIAQLVVAEYVSVQWHEVPALEETARGAQGHGSTGIA